MSTSSHSNRGYRRGQRISDLMTREYHAFVKSSLAAERDGDAATALEYHQGVPLFARSTHRTLLAQLAALADEMTPWLWARWAAYQCTRVEDPGTECAQIQRFALDYTLRMFHADEMAATYEAGGDPVPFIAHTLGEDWAFHQICTYELDGLRRFLDTMATGTLADECTLARAWTEARMGAFRVEAHESGDLVVRDLGQGRPVALLDLGARVHTGAGGWVIGRLVPSGTTPGQMFDTRPLPVDEQTAREVAADAARGTWISALERAVADGRLDRGALQAGGRELVTDVPGLQLVEVATASAALSSTLEQLRAGRDEVGRAAYRVLRAVAEGTFETDHPAAYVTAAALNAHGYAEARSHLVQPGYREAWTHWADRVPDPARGRLRRLGQLCGDAAA